MTLMIVPSSTTTKTEAQSTATLRTLTRLDETGRALLVAPHDLLASEGPSALTVWRIAAAAGVSTLDAGAVARQDAFRVAMALWACQHGLVSPAARTSDVEGFDWDVVAPLGSAAIVRGFAAGDG